jgi:hypothetical protein
MCPILHLGRTSQDAKCGFLDQISMMTYSLPEEINRLDF